MTARDPATGRFRSTIHTAGQLATGVIALWLVSRLVSPGNQTAEVIRSMGAGLETMIAVAAAERAIENRDVPRVETLLGTMTDDLMTELFAGLTDADLDWVESHLSMGVVESYLSMGVE